MTRIEIRATRFWIVATAVTASMLVAVGAWAYGGRHHGGPGGPFHAFLIERMLDRADASDEQREQITAILGAAREEVDALREETHEGFREQMLTLLTAESVDADAVEALRLAHQEQIERSMARMSQALVEAAGLLSQEQRIAIAEALREHRDHHGHHGGCRDEDV